MDCIESGECFIYLFSVACFCNMFVVSWMSLKDEQVTDYQMEFRCQSDTKYMSK